MVLQDRTEAHAQPLRATFLAWGSPPGFRYTELLVIQRMITQSDSL